MHRKLKEMYLAKIRKSVVRIFFINRKKIITKKQKNFLVH